MESQGLKLKKEDHQFTSYPFCPTLTDINVMQLSIRSLNVRISSVSFCANCCTFLTQQYSAYNR